MDVKGNGNGRDEGQRKSFHSLQTGKHIARERDPILSPVGPWIRKSKNIRELRGAIFLSKFSPKTLMNIDPNAIFTKNGPEARHCLDSGAISAAFATDRRIAYMLIKIPYIRKNVKCLSPSGLNHSILWKTVHIPNRVRITNILKSASSI